MAPKFAQPVDARNPTASVMLILDGNCTVRELSIAWMATGAKVLDGQALRDLLSERLNQVEQHGFTLDHDRGHSPEVLARAAESYALTAQRQLMGAPDALQQPSIWPFENEWWNPRDARTNALKAAAILWALADRIDYGPDGTGENVCSLPVDRHIAGFPKGATA
jgi:hypothetical protein